MARHSLIAAIALLGTVFCTTSIIAAEPNTLDAKLLKSGYTTGEVVDKVQHYKVDGWNDAVSTCANDTELVTALYAGAKARTGKDPKLAIEWFQKAGFLGNAQARYFAQHLLSRGNFVGFRNEQEEAAVIAGKLRTGLLWEEPVGMLFRNSGERLAYIRNLRYRVDRYEAYQAWVLRKNEYDECKRGNRSSCSEPGPAPQ